MSVCSLKEIYWPMGLKVGLYWRSPAADGAFKSNGNATARAIPFETTNPFASNYLRELRRLLLHRATCQFSAK
jgi:hypothetical protein